MNIPVSEKGLLTIREAAAYYSIGVKNMRRLAENHKGEFAVLLGNKFLISPSRFEDFLFDTKNAVEIDTDMEEI